MTYHDLEKSIVPSYTSGRTHRCRFLEEQCTLQDTGTDTKPLKGNEVLLGRGNISISYISLLRGAGKKKAQVHRPPSDVFPSPCILCLLRLEDPSIVPLSPDKETLQFFGKAIQTKISMIEGA